MRTRRKLLSSTDGTGAIWPAFTDVTSTIALILFVLVLLAYVQNLISGKQLAAYRAQITSSEQELRKLEHDLKSTTAEIEAGKARLKLSELKLQEQQQVIADSNSELENLRSRLSGIALLRVEVLQKVKQSIEGQLGARSSADQPLVTIGDNGNIIINEGLVFEFNSYDLKPEGKVLLHTLAQALSRVLDDAEVRASIDSIVVQGHTDERGTSAFNRDLSAKRANAVLDYLFQANPALETAYGSYFSASAYSEFRPINSEKTEVGYEQNRRIELSVVLKDAQVRQVIQEYTDSLAPTLTPNLQVPDPALDAPP